MTDRLLLLSCEPHRNDFFGTTLPEAGFLLKSVTSYDQVLRSLNEYKPDLILVDTTLEEQSGFTICSSLHKDSMSSIVLFGYKSQIELWLERPESGADYFLILSWEDKVKLELLRAILRRQCWNNFSKE